eukprot:scaffold215470_cov16-Prasinocladus_malaysianus.AAC.1
MSDEQAAGDSTIAVCTHITVHNMGRWRNLASAELELVWRNPWAIGTERLLSSVSLYNDCWRPHIGGIFRSLESCRLVLSNGAAIAGYDFGLAAIFGQLHFLGTQCPRVPSRTRVAVAAPDGQQMSLIETPDLAALKNVHWIDTGQH